MDNETALEPFELYNELRRQVLTLGEDYYKTYQKEEAPDFVYAALVDIDMGETYASLACFIDGTTSLYFSNGGGIIGAGQEHEEVRTATAHFLDNAILSTQHMQPADNFDLPKNKKQNVYLMTPKGIYKEAFDPTVVQNYSREMKYLFYLYQSTLKILGDYSKPEPPKCDCC
ncbi:MAG: hypothetical protein ACC608_13215 [Anaerofustis sp.]